MVYITQKQLENLQEIKLKIDKIIQKIGKKRIDKLMFLYFDYRLGRQYLKLLSYNLNQSSQNLSKRININEPLIRSWFKGSHPHSITALLKIYNRKYHLIKKKVLAYLVGYGFGDGGLKSNLLSFFMCGVKDDLKSITNYLKEGINTNLNIKLELNNGKNVIRNKEGKLRFANFGESWIIYIYDSVFAKLLYVYGLSKGEKVLQEFLVPEWIKNGSKKNKREFLEGLFESELQKYKIRFNQKRKKIEISPISFGLGKVKEYQENLIQFLNEIKELCASLGIKCSNCESPKHNTKRKDGKTTVFSRFGISSSALNVCKFAKIIDFKFNKEKRLALEDAVREAKRKLSLFNNQFLKYEKAINLYREGWNCFKIAKELGVYWDTVNGWITGEFVPHPYEDKILVEEFLNGKFTHRT